MKIQKNSFAMVDFLQMQIKKKTPFQTRFFLLLLTLLGTPLVFNEQMSIVAYCGLFGFVAVICTKKLELRRRLFKVEELQNTEIKNLQSNDF